MSIIEKIKADQLTARKARDLVAASLLTTLMSDALMVAKNDGREAPTDDEVIATVRKFLKGNAEVQANVTDERLGIAIQEAVILDNYLPEQMTSEALRCHVTGFIKKGPTDMGKVMGYLKSNFAGLYDGKMASSIIKDELAK
jgi:uncharacterized protein YqeY